MAPLDPHVASVLDHNRTAAADSSDEDALIAELEEDNDSSALDAFREQRREQLHQEMSRAKALKETQHGTYQEIKDEKQLMDITTSTERCIVHFMKPDFNRCRIMDGKLAVLAEKHYEARFVSINVENAPFLVVKLGIQVLPCVVCFRDAVGVDRVVGFEGVGRKPDDCDPGMLEGRFLGSGILERAKIGEGGEGVGFTGKKKVKAVEEDYDDDEWD